MNLILVIELIIMSANILLNIHIKTQWAPVYKKHHKKQQVLI